MRLSHFVRVLLSVLSAAVLLCSLSGCGGGEGAKTVDYRDGTYTGRSADHQEDEDGNGAGYGEVTLTVSGQKITDCTFKMYHLDGTLKDETYGADLTKENRLKAQKAVQSADKYADALVKSGFIEAVDVISGATISHSEFKEAVEAALRQAEKTA